MKKLFLYIILCMLLVLPAYALDTELIIAYYEFDQGEFLNDSSGNAHHLTNYSAVAGSDCIVNQCAELSGADGVYLLTTNNMAVTNSTGAMCYWANRDATTNSDQDWSYSIDGDEANRIELMYLNNDYRYYASGGADFQSTTDANTGGWDWVCFNFDGANIEIWINATFQEESGNVWLDDITPRQLFIGAYQDAILTYDGTLDEWMVVERNLTQQEMTDLYDDYVLGYSPYNPQPPATPYLEVVLTGITIFNGTINDTFYSTTNGTINTNIPSNATQLITIVLDSENYFNKTISSYNTTADLTTTLNRYPIINLVNTYNKSFVPKFNMTVNGTAYSSGDNVTIKVPDIGTVSASLTKGDYISKTADVTLAINETVNFTAYQTEIIFKAYEKVSNSQINNFTIIDPYYNNATTNGTIVLHPNSDVNSLNITTTTGYYNITKTFSFSALETGDRNFSLYNHELLVTPLDFFTNVSLFNFTINITSLNYSGFNEYYNTTNSNITLNLTAGLTYNITVDPADYASNISILTLTGANSSHPVYLFKENSVYIRIYDEETGNLINYETVNVEFIGDNLATENTTSTGSLIVQPLIAGDYRIRYSSASYPERLYFATVTAGGTQAIDVYLLNASSLTNITTIVKDEKGDYVEGAYVKLLRYYLSCNCYKTVEIGLTNFEGETGLRAVFNDELYKFIVQYNDIVYLESEAFKITSNVLTFIIRIDELDPTVNLRRKQNIIYNLSFNNATNNFVFTFSDLNNLVTTGCLDVYKITVMGETLHNSSCVNSTGATLYTGIQRINSTTYRAIASVNIDGVKTQIDSLFKSFTSGSEVLGLFGVFATILLVIVFGFIGRWSPSVAIIMVSVAVILSRMFGLIQLGITPIMGLIGVGVIIALLNRA